MQLNDRGGAKPVMATELTSFSRRRHSPTGEREVAIEPARPIIDCHHHFMSQPGLQYELPEILEDTRAGHNIIATIHIEVGGKYRQDSTPGYAPIGETEYVNELATKCASGSFRHARVCAGIVAYVDLKLGSQVQDVVAGHIDVAGKRLKGVRNISAFHHSSAVRSSNRLWPERLLADSNFRDGAACLATLGLVFDTFCYHTQIDEVTNLARAVPNLTIVLDHVGGPLGIGPYDGMAREVYADWRAKMARLALEPNVFVKLGGLGMKMNGFKFDERESPPTSDELAQVWGPYITETIERFGARRCMFESNFPVDRVSCDYVALWNAFKKIVGNSSESEKSSLFCETARYVYKLDDVNPAE